MEYKDPKKPEYDRERQSILILSFLLGYLLCHLLTTEYKVMAPNMDLVKTKINLSSILSFFKERRLSVIKNTVFNCRIILQVNRCLRMTSGFCKHWEGWAIRGYQRGVSHDLREPAAYREAQPKHIRVIETRYLQTVSRALALRQVPR